MAIDRKCVVCLAPAIVECNVQYGYAMGSVPVYYMLGFCAKHQHIGADDLARVIDQRMKERTDDRRYN